MPEHRWGIGGEDPKNALILAKANRNFLLFLQGIVNFKALLCKLLCIPLHYHKNREYYCKHIQSCIDDWKNAVHVLLRV